ncbi:hypothetical protein BDV26DRAFT_293161 [Aspergillus bertholletiae]|uniref:Uncharacterized protein n=1 Tax=Aspergillus bertholletiae TaxID=1226010 RepID=A0A5N7B6W4_9EURO|nr:hypothetical protein BDV26DRAFT_293161 [Aspergillus bertholletiae]
MGAQGDANQRTPANPAKAPWPSQTIPTEGLDGQASPSSVPWESSKWAHNWFPYWSFSPGHADCNAVSNAPYITSSHDHKSANLQGNRALTLPSLISATHSRASRTLPASDRGNMTTPSSTHPPPQQLGAIDDIIACSSSGSHTISKIERDISEDSGSKNEADDKKGMARSSLTQSRLELKRLASLGFEGLTDDQAAYYFGVLAIEKLLLPQLYLSYKRRKNSWGVKLTLYGQTIVRPHAYKTLEEAKAGTYRHTLRPLAADHPEWTAPVHPTEQSVTPCQDWVEILRGKRTGV